MAQIPDKINTTYLAGITPSVQASIIVAQALNRIIDYLVENETKIASLPDFSKDIREQS